jgi:hypothetical protein
MTVPTDCSDEEIVNTWMENPYVQYFTGETYFQTEAQEVISCDQIRVRITAIKRQQFKIRRRHAQLHDVAVQIKFLTVINDVISFRH